MNSGKESAKKYPVPTDIAELMDESFSAKNARDAAVKGYFKFQVRNAVYLGKISIQKEREFWKRIRELYPELGAAVTYDRDEYIVWDTTKES